jgi:hypothetical protein
MYQITRKQLLEPPSGVVSTRPATNPPTTGTTISVPWPDGSLSQIALTGLLMRLKVLTNDDQFTYRVSVTLKSDAKDLALVNVEKGIPGWEISGGILGTFVQEDDLPNDHYTPILQSDGFNLVMRAYSTSPAATDAANLPFKAEVTLHVSYAQFDANGRIILESPARVVQVESTLNAKQALVLKDDGTLWFANDVTIATPVWVQKTTP